MRLIFGILTALIGLLIFMHPWRHYDNQEAGPLANPDPLVAMHNVNRAAQELQEHMKELDIAPPENNGMMPTDALNAPQLPGDGPEAASPASRPVVQPKPVLPPPDRFFVHHNEISVDDKSKDTMGFSQEGEAAGAETPHSAHHYYDITVVKDKKTAPPAEDPAE